MRTFYAAALAAVAVLVFVTPASAARGLEYLGSKQLTPRLQELTFRTPALAEETGVRVLLPDGYDAAKRKRYPVLYLLNGSLDDQTAWTEKGAAEKITAAYPLIVVMPSGGAFGNYTDWYNDGAGGPPEWETYHIEQLLPWIDSHFRTAGTRAGRAVAGLSMGGGGTMAYAARHPDLFTAAGSFSGAVDTNNVFVQPLTETSGASEGAEPGAVYGHRATEEIRWRGHNPWDLAENLRGKYLEVHTGNGNGGGPGGDSGDPVESGVHQQSVSFHERLLELGIQHLWNDYGAGGHAWYYWQRDLTEMLPRLMNVFAHPPRKPSRFDFKATEPRYSVFGWKVSIARPALEFSTLGRAGRGGFRLSGSGDAVVRTARLYRRHQRLRVSVSGLDGVQRKIVRAGAHGRLRLAIKLGPGNPYQQYTPEGKEWAAQNGASDSTGRPVEDSDGWPVYTTTVTVKPRA
jgi:S-formylglutathione hydrolase FrmB